MISGLPKRFMISFINYSAIIWDFDGVLMDSMPVRDRGFERVLASYPSDQVQALMHYHRQNGGLSRYVKFRYFFEKIRGESVSEAQIEWLAAQFSEVMRKELIREELLISDTVQFVKRHYNRIPMHVVSGSDHHELRYLCGALNLQPFFRSIAGSPTAKKQLVAQLILDHQYNASQLVLIGDSRNDWDAAVENQIDFMGYNNTSLIGLGAGYISSFERVILSVQ